MEDLKNMEVRRGPKKKYKVKIPKSKISEISVNTAAYSKARTRIKFELLQEIFDKTKENDNLMALWHGKRTFITDGTYVQMQDTEELQEIYNVNHNDEEHKDRYPQGLIQAIIEQGSGFIHDYALSDRHSSELSLIYQLIQSIPKDSLLLADDLYNCYAIFALARTQGFDLIVPGKRVKKYTVVEVIAKGVNGNYKCRISVNRNASKSASLISDLQRNKKLKNDIFKDRFSVFQPERFTG
jgi:hypothetical protein